MTKSIAIKLQAGKSIARRHNITIKLYIFTIHSPFSSTLVIQKILVFIYFRNSYYYGRIEFLKKHYLLYTLDSISGNKVMQLNSLLSPQHIKKNP